MSAYNTRTTDSEFMFDKTLMLCGLVTDIWHPTVRWKRLLQHLQLDIWLFFVWNSQARNTSFPSITLFIAKNTVDYMTQAVLYESLCTFDKIFFAHQLRTGRIKHIVRASINLLQVTLKSFVQYTEESCQIILTSRSWLSSIRSTIGISVIVVLNWAVIIYRPILVKWIMNCVTNAVLNQEEM